MTLANLTNPGESPSRCWDICKDGGRLARYAEMEGYLPWVCGFKRLWPGWGALPVLLSAVPDFTETLMIARLCGASCTRIHVDHGDPKKLPYLENIPGRKTPSAVIPRVTSH